MDIVFQKHKIPQSINRTIYLKKSLSDRIDNLAKEMDICFNRIVVSMIEYCIEELEK